MKNDLKDAYADIPPFLDAAAIARLFGLADRVGARWLSDGTVPSVKLGKKRYALRHVVLGMFGPDGPGRKG